MDYLNQLHNASLPTVHVWKISLPNSVDTIDETQQLILDESEQQRASKFYFEKDRAAYIQSHIAMRRILSLYLKIEPNQIKYELSPMGKPRCPSDLNPSQITFNLSHTKGMALVAIASKLEVGVDLERLDRKCRFNDVAQRFFAPKENDFLSKVGSKEYAQTFFQLWTLKEAYLKATGDGISNSLSQVEFAIRSHEGFQTIKLQQDPQAHEHWCSHTISIPPDYIAGVVLNARELSLERFVFNSSE